MKTVHPMNEDHVKWRARQFAALKHCAGSTTYIRYRRRLSPNLLREFDDAFMEERKRILNKKA
jgi:hypothetical protein